MVAQEKGLAATHGAHKDIDDFARSLSVVQLHLCLIESDKERSEVFHAEVVNSHLVSPAFI